MSCTKNNKCGCSDQPIVTPPACNQTGPCAGETCSELFCEECIVHCQPNITAIGEGFKINISQGMRLDEIIQTFLIHLTNRTCVGKSVVGLKMISKTATSIFIKWVGVPDIIYEVSWEEGNNQYTAQVHDVYQYEIINLIPNTEYKIKIITDPAGSACDSVLMSIRTNSI